MKSVTSRNIRKSHVRRKSVSVTIDHAYLVAKLFQQKTWDSYYGAEKVMERYTNLVAGLTEPQRDFFMELTARFLWINDYQQNVVTQMNRILDHLETWGQFPVSEYLRDKI